LDLNDDILTLLTRYLLGELTEEEQERVEQRYFADADYLEALRSVESDLTDRYIRRELTGTAREHFEREFLGSPAGRKRVLFADALARSLAASSSEDRHRVDDKPPTRRYIPALAGDRKWQPLLIAASAVVISMSVLLFWRGTLLRRTVSPPIASESPVTGVPAGNPNSPTPAATAEPSPPSGPTVAEFVLAPGRLRSEREKMLVISDRIKTVRLSLQLQSEEYASFGAALAAEANGATIWQRKSLKLQHGRAGTGIYVEIPAGLLTRQNVIHVTGVTGSGDVEAVNDYYFGVKR
jgi:hypothetical protein